MKKGNLLIVDDEILILKRLKVLLEEYADKVLTAVNGVEALKIFETIEIHCIVCDINMPQKNGVEVIKELRERGSTVPFIFYTGHGSEELMLEAVKYGAFDFLNKPNLDGIEEVVVRGLRDGISPNRCENNDEESYISEYRKLIDKLESD